MIWNMNVRTMVTARKMEEIATEMMEYRIKVVALEEITWGRRMYNT